MTRPSTKSDKQSPDRRKVVFLVVLAAIAVGAWFLFRDHLTFETLAQKQSELESFRDSNFALAVILFIAVYTVMVAFSLPGAAVATLAGGFLFGVFPGALINVVGATLGAMLLFAAAKWGLGDYLASKMDTSTGAINKLKVGIDQNQWSMLFLMRLVPVVPFFVANLIPALVGVRFGRFAISTFIGIIPGSIVYTSVGAGLSDVFARGETPDLNVLKEPFVLLPIVGLCLLAALPIILNVLKAKGASNVQD